MLMGHFLRQPPVAPTTLTSCTGGTSHLSADPRTLHMLDAFREQAFQMSVEARKAFEAFHTVGGQKRFGLVIDPGAASGH